MLRITRIAPPRGDGEVLKVEGKLVGAWVEELRRECSRAPSSRGPLCLDLGAVSFVDGDGVRLLRELLASGNTLAACSRLVAAILQGERA